MIILFTVAKEVSWAIFFTCRLSCTVYISFKFHRKLEHKIDNIDNKMNIYTAKSAIA